MIQLYHLFIATTPEREISQEIRGQHTSPRQLPQDPALPDKGASSPNTAPRALQTAEDQQVGDSKPKAEQKEIAQSIQSQDIQCPPPAPTRPVTGAKEQLIKGAPTKN